MVSESLNHVAVGLQTVSQVAFVLPCLVSFVLFRRITQVSSSGGSRVVRAAQEQVPVHMNF